MCHLKKGTKEKVSYWGWPDEQSSWTWPGNEGKIMQVKVYSPSEKVQLFLNDKKIDEKTISDTSKLTAVFDVPYQAGILKAIAFNREQEVGSKVLITAGQVAAIRLTADRPVIKASRNDLAYVAVEAIDEKGNLVPNANVRVTASVSGEGELLASGNASPNDMENFHKPAFKLFNGKGLIIVRPLTKAGSIEVKVEAGKLKTALVKIRTE